MPTVARISTVKLGVRASERLPGSVVIRQVSLVLEFGLKKSRPGTSTSDIDISAALRLS